MAARTCHPRLLRRMHLLEGVGDRVRKAEAGAAGTSGVPCICAEAALGRPEEDRVESDVDVVAVLDELVVVRRGGAEESGGSSRVVAAHGDRCEAAQGFADDKWDGQLAGELERLSNRPAGGVDVAVEEGCEPDI